MMKNGKTQREFEIKKGIREGLTEDQARMRTKRKWRRNWTRNMIKSATFDFILPALWAYGLNAAWYAIFGDDEKRKQEDAEDAIKRGMLGGFEGFSGGGTVPDVVYSIAQGDSKWVSVGRTPAEESVMSLLNAVNAGNMERAAQQGFNTLVSLGVGFNPQVIEDAVVAGIDFMGADEKSNREWAMLFMRVMSCPQSQIDRVYYDELGLDAREAQKRTPAELAERYATYKARRANFASLWMMDQERFEEAKEPYRKRFEKEAKARIESLNDESVNDRLAKYEDEYKAVGHEVTALGDLKLEERAERARELYSTERGERYKLYNGLHANLNAMIKSWLEADSPEKAAADAAAIVKYKEKIVEMLDKSGDKSASKQLRHEAIEIVKEWHKNQ
jgi:hypothetical protein